MYGTIFMVAALLFGLSAHAQVETYTNGLQGDSIQPGKTLVAQDTVFFNPSLLPTIAHTNRVNNIINFSFNEFSNILLPDSFSVTLTVRIIFTVAGNQVDSILSLPLTINYNKNGTYSSKAIMSFQNAYKVEVKILDTAAQNVSFKSILPALQLENDIEVNRNYTMNCEGDAIKKISDSISSVITDGELKVYWAWSRAAAQYDLEWAWVDESALLAGIYNKNGQPDPDLIFKNNATRVTITGTEYKIPLLYDGDGSLFFRVRGSQTLPSGEIKATSWSSDFIQSGGLGRYDFTGHSRNLNWQATTSFAEGGKRKSVVQYFDGGLRSRQTVTKDNTTNTTVVAETLYDFQGRPAIQVLPAPTLSNMIAFTPRFNADINGNEYEKSMYDGLDGANGYCSGTIPGMGADSGASRYYSPANPLVNQTFNKFIPNAHLYPFAQTQYTQDNTGRIYRQGGVDSIFQIGRGHETKYYYGSPEQNDLDALFGTEAGDATHYQKSMVRDANGQYSVSYADMNGRTIATALAGKSPDNVSSLASYNISEQTSDLLGSGNIIDGLSIRSTKSLLVTKAGLKSFTYKMAAEELTIEDCFEKNICYDCLYDLTITITDNCNNELIGGAPIVINKRNFQLFKVDTTCGLVIPMDTTFQLNLVEGEYNITKTLSISKYGMDYYHDSVFVPNNTCRTYEEIFREQMDSIISRFDCEPVLNNEASYTSYREQMLQDVSPPSGQYADTSSMLLYQNKAYQNTGFSIFKKSNGIYPYKNPNPQIPYADESGRPDSVVNFNGKLVPPGELSIDEFTANFTDSWANSLLFYHPEACFLNKYEELSASLTWDDDFQNTDTYAAAVAKGYLNPTGNTTELLASRYGVLNTDPLFSSDLAIGQIAKLAIEDSLFRTALPPGGPYGTISLWNLATITAHCKDLTTSGCFDAFYNPEKAFDTISLCTGDLDMAWRIFRGFYENIKANWIDQYLRSQCGNLLIDVPYIAVFNNQPDLLINPEDIPGAIADGKAQLDSLYKSTAEGYVTAWWQQLGPCNYTAADSAIIIPRLIKICELGSDEDHLFGSSSIRPGSTYFYSSFVEVIERYNDSVYNGQKNPNYCNGYLITNPAPYNQSALLVNMPLWSTPDSCACAVINNYYDAYSRLSSQFSNFSEYVQKKIGVVMSQGSLDTLRNACNIPSACQYFENPISLPPAFQCGVRDVCVDCATVQQWNADFRIRFPGLLPTLSEQDTSQRKINEMFAGFMNYQSGFSYSAQDYLTFMNSCDSTQGDSTNCSALIWTVFNPGQNLSIHNDLYNAAVNNILPVDQFFAANSFFNGPQMSQAGNYVLVNKKDSLFTTDSIVVMQWRVKPVSIEDAINPVIQTGSTTYVGAEWAPDPADSTWLIGTTKIKVSDGMLKGMGIQSSSYGLLADWVKITGSSTSSVLFFDDFLKSGDCNLNGPRLCGKTALDSTITKVQTSPCEDSTAFAVALATEIYNAYKDSLSDYFREAYINKCLNAINLESFTLRDTVSEYHYTLYYYDQAGNLVKTIPPEGVHPDWSQTWAADVKAAKATGTRLAPPHTLPTIYRYNSLNQVVSQNTPDAGSSTFWYDKLGRLVVSQNAKQATPLSIYGEGQGVRYSYTLYDSIGRITEVGQKSQPTAMTNTISRDPEALAAWLNFNTPAFAYNAEQVTSTVYDVVAPTTKNTFPGDTFSPVIFGQQAYTLRNRVSYTQYYDELKTRAETVSEITSYSPRYGNYTTGTYYNYDIHGNVDTLLQDYGKKSMMADHGFNRYKEIAYRYDLISGKVNEVHYQPGAIDQFYHRYEYDAENRITDVYTTTNKAYIGHKNLEEHEAFYEYYKHGPLARTVLGQQQVQGVDYAYTLQGWLKGVNSTSINPMFDMGADGLVSPSGGGGGRDAYSYSLNYFNGDYSPIGSGGVSPFPGFSGLFSSGHSNKPLHNGNISAMAVNIGKLNAPMLYNYQYDQLNRLVAMDAFTGLNGSTNKWNSLATDSSYRERISYDANGNILTYLRNGTKKGGTLLDMDNLSYKYFRDTDGTLRNNRLRMVRDAVPAANYSEDIDDQLSSIKNEADSNYVYDAIGNLIKDSAGGIKTISWTVYGKISEISKTDGTIISYTYDAAGNRISKTLKPKKGKATTTWYVRDASGNTMAVYTVTGKDSLYQSEQHLYGSSRLGIYNRKINADAPLPTGTEANLIGNYVVAHFTRGNKNYELSNHLGNVLLTLSDKKFGHSGDGSLIDYYDADVVSANDYYPFGMGMPGRKYSIANTNYRYGFNGKELDKETSSTTTYDYGFRIYSPGLGRFLSVDPLTKSYPWYTPYQFAGNSAISNIDLDGREDLWFMRKVVTFYIKIKNAGENFKSNVSEMNAAANNNYGFDETENALTLQEQVEENKLRLQNAKLKIIGDFIKVGGYGAAATTVIFAAPLAAAALPELFAITGTLQLNTTGSYLVQRTVQAALDAGAQKIVNGKVDLFDVATKYLPVNSKLGKALVSALEASIDYDKDKGFKYILGVDNNYKPGSDALIEAFTSAAGKKLFGRFNKELKNAFESNGLKGNPLTNAMGQVLKGQAEFIQNTLKFALIEEVKDLNDSKNEN